MDIATTLIAQGDTLTKQIESKMNPGCARQNPTPRRLRQVASMFEDGVRLSKIQTALYTLATLHKKNNAPALLRKVTKKSDIAHLLFDSRDHDSEWYNRTLDLGARTEMLYEAMQQDAAGLVDDNQYNAQRRRAALFAKGHSLIGQIPGYFPTPLPVAKRLIDLIGDDLGPLVFDPSAGGGAILDAVKEYSPTTPTAGIEYNYELAELCREKGHDVTRGDCFQNAGTFSTLLANPPFEHDGDCTHGLFYFHTMLAPGGKLAMITGSGAFFHKTPVALEFQALVEAYGYYEPLPEGSFKSSMTGVHTCIVYLEKPN